MPFGGYRDYSHNGDYGESSRYPGRGSSSYSSYNDGHEYDRGRSRSRGLDDGFSNLTVSGGYPEMSRSRSRSRYGESGLDYDDERGRSWSRRHSSDYLEDLGVDWNSRRSSSRPYAASDRAYSPSEMTAEDLLAATQLLPAAPGPSIAHVASVPTMLASSNQDVQGQRMTRTNFLVDELHPGSGPHRTQKGLT